MAPRRDAPTPRRRVLLAALAGAGVGGVLLGVRELRGPGAPVSPGDEDGAGRDFTVRPTGDDGRDVQRAIDTVHSAGGGTVRLPGVTFRCDAPVHLRTGVALVGSGPSTVLKAGPDFLRARGPYGGHPLVTTAGADDVLISDLTADQSGDALDGRVPERLTEYLLDVRDSRGARVERVRTLNPFSYSIAVVGSSDFLVRDCATLVRSTGRYDQLDGIHVLDSSHGQVLDNDVDQGGPDRDGDDGLVAHTVGQQCHHVEYRRNRVRSGRWGGAMQLAVGDGDIHHITVADNVFYDSLSGVRVGDWGGQGIVHDVVVGGAGSGNVFVGHERFAVDLSGRVGGGLVISHNTSMDAGPFLAAPGTVITANRWTSVVPAVLPEPGQDTSGES